MRKGDRVIAVWGRLTGYMTLKEVMGILLEKPSLELKCDIERTVSINVNPGVWTNTNNLIGASFSMEFDGLTVSGVKEYGAAIAAGLKKSDLITAIDGKSTRYMPLKNAIDLIKNSQGGSIKLTLRREVLIWRRS